jgi:aryl-alcohol dehydrogenase-like predicted oxidoreductase
LTTFYETRALGRTGFPVGRLGVATSYGAPAAAFEEAFEHGVNYFYWGSRRSRAMVDAVTAISKKGSRDDLLIVMQSYARSATLMRRWFHKGLKKLGQDRVEVLLLGWHNSLPSPRILDEAMALKEAGLIRFIGLSGHNRPLFPELARDDRFDLFHVRYNAVHRGAESEVFDRLPEEGRPGIVTFTATRWGDLLKAKKMPPGESPPRASDCYRFALSNPAVDLCMTGPGSVEQMREALSALDRGPLDDEEMVRMRRIGDHIHAKHKRPFSG